jgi:3D (Asp-Asp-Asp) domain-containing protein
MLSRRSFAALLSLVVCGCAPPEDAEEIGFVQQEMSYSGAKLTRYTLVGEAETSGQKTGDTSMSCNPGLNGACYHKEFLCSGYGVAMQGTGVALDGKVIRYINGGGGWAAGYSWLNDCSSATFAVTDAARGASGRVLSADWSIAVDPAYITLGSYVWIESQNHWYRADDTGGAIDGTHIDVFVADTGWSLGATSSDVFVASDGKFRGHGSASPYVQAQGCSPITTQGAIIDDMDPCFSVLGNHLHWHAEKYGHDSSLIWTNPGTRENVAQWRMRFEAAGDYDLEVFIPEKFAGSRRAKYRVIHSAGTQEIEIDQTQGSGYASLGRFFFEADREYSVELADDTGEASDVTIAFDALRVTLAGQAPPDGSEPGSEPGEDPNLNPYPDPSGDASSGADLVGACAAGGQQSAWLGLLWVTLLAVRRRSR